MIPLGGPPALRHTWRVTISAGEVRAAAEQMASRWRSAALGYPPKTTYRVEAEQAAESYDVWVKVLSRLDDDDPLELVFTDMIYFGITLDTADEIPDWLPGGDSA